MQNARANNYDPGQNEQKTDSKVNVGQPERLASLAGGTLLTLWGLTRTSLPGLLVAVGGGYLIYRGATGHCYVNDALGINTAAGEQQQGIKTVIPHKEGIKVQKSVTISRAPAELYRFWRNFENLPRFMNHLESVTMLGDKRSHWVAKAPLGQKVEWDAEIINEKDNELIGWRSLEGSQIPNAGSVHFEPAPDGRGTEVTVELEYNPPAGALGAAVAKMLGEEPDAQVQDDLHRFKQVMEAGEAAPTDGQPSASAVQ
ncbi:MAG: cyclase [Candidatus Chloroheliales bacterium]|nr:MAG: cyclase [Chloroflexota bacterium]